MNIELTKEQEDVIIRKHGSLDYATTYLAAYADHLLVKEGEDSRQAKVDKLLQASDKVLDEAVAKAELESEAIEEEKK